MVRRRASQKTALEVQTGNCFRALEGENPEFFELIAVQSEYDIQFAIPVDVDDVNGLKRPGVGLQVGVGLNLMIDEGCAAVGDPEGRRELVGEGRLLDQATEILVPHLGLLLALAWSGSSEDQEGTTSAGAPDCRPRGRKHEARRDIQVRECRPYG